MTKLTACGVFFGKGEVHAQDGYYDLQWKLVKERLLSDGSFEKVRMTTVVIGIPRHLVKDYFLEQAVNWFPTKPPDEDIKRYVNELVDLIYESD